MVAGLEFVFGLKTCPCNSLSSVAYLQTTNEIRGDWHCDNDF